MRTFDCTPKSIKVRRQWLREAGMSSRKAKRLAPNATFSIDFSMEMDTTVWVASEPINDQPIESTRIIDENR